MDGKSNADREYCMEIRVEPPGLEEVVRELDPGTKHVGRPIRSPRRPTWTADPFHFPSDARCFSRLKVERCDKLLSLWQMNSEHSMIGSFFDELLFYLSFKDKWAFFPGEGQRDELALYPAPWEEGLWYKAPDVVVILKDRSGPL